MWTRVPHLPLPWHRVILLTILTEEQALTKSVLIIGVGIAVEGSPASRHLPWQRPWGMI